MLIAVVPLALGGVAKEAEFGDGGLASAVEPALAIWKPVGPI